MTGAFRFTILYTLIFSLNSIQILDTGFRPAFDPNTIHCSFVPNFNPNIIHFAFSPNFHPSTIHYGPCPNFDTDTIGFHSGIILVLTL